jgi:hypothetical protein
MLTPDDLLQFVRFENELRLVHDDGCTTTDHYVVKSKFFTLQTKDGDCTWDGFRKLTTAWFRQ